MISGVDLSTWQQMQDAGITYFNQKKAIKDVLSFISEKGINSVRLRLWNDPFDENHLSYAGGENNLSTTLRIAQHMYNHHFSVFLDFHYSDFWADPGKQFKPKAWQNFPFVDLVSAVEKFTVATLIAFKKADIPVSFVQIGNEITNGLLWPDGKIFAGDEIIPGGFDRLSQLLQAGISATRKVFPQAKIVLHLERSGDADYYVFWFQEMQKRKVDFDIIGLSYYPFYHGSLNAFSKTIDVCQQTLKCSTMIVETGYIYTTKSVEGNSLIVDDENDQRLPYPPTLKGQAAFIDDLLTLVKEKSILGFYYWEPLWLPGPHVSWSSLAGRKYIKEENKKGGNEWANHALFDYDGHALPAWNMIEKHCKE